MTLSLSADDRFALHDLFARYSRALDTGDYEAYAALFTPDAHLEIEGEDFHGRVAIRNYIKRLTSPYEWAGYRHHNTQFVFEEGDGTRCRTSCNSMNMFRNRDGSVEFRQQGIYQDVCVKVDGVWYFAERRWEEWNHTKLVEYRLSPR